MKKRLLILADDLTGALDTGVKFAEKGIETMVQLSPLSAETADSNESNDKNITVRVINTNTRHTTPEEARRIIKNAAAAFGAYTFFYKKTDSCLRGNTGAELEALIETTKSSCLPFVPSYPKLKRITKNGTQYLEGKPIHETSMASDPLNPITESFIPAIIKKQSAIPLRLMPANPKTLEMPKIPGPEILIFDSEKTSQLKPIAKQLFKKDLLKASAGCAGFAEALMEVLPLEKAPVKNAVSIPKLPVLVISGSVHPVSVKQVKATLSKNVLGLSLAGERIIKPNWIYTEEARTLVASCSQALREKGICIMGTEAAFGMNAMGLNAVELNAAVKPGGLRAANSIPDVLGEVVKLVIQITGPLHLVVFGGDSLQGIMNTLNISCLKPVKEIKPGVVLSVMGSGYLVSKAGAFGASDIIFKIVNYINKGR